MNKKSAGNIVVGLWAIIAGISHLINNGGRPTGKLEFILAPIYDAIGDTGYAIATMLVGILFLAAGYLNKGEESK